jgi:hypothetical protein
MSFPLHESLGRVAVMSFAAGVDDADPEPYVGHLNALAIAVPLVHRDGAGSTIPLSNPREKRIACGGSCRESRHGTSARSLVSAKTPSTFTSGRR